MKAIVWRSLAAALLALFPWMQAGAETRMAITDFGAMGDGERINTQSIQAAVDACSDNGGGTVVIPPGVSLSGSIELKSRITLSLEPGAVLMGSGNLSDYPPRGFLVPGLGETRSLLFAKLFRRRDGGSLTINIVDRRQEAKIPFELTVDLERHDFSMGQTRRHCMSLIAARRRLTRRRGSNN